MGDYLDNVIELPMSGERWCQIHDTMWADCGCPGPHEEENMPKGKVRITLEFEYDQVQGTIVNAHPKDWDYQTLLDITDPVKVVEVQDLDTDEEES